MAIEGNEPKSTKSSPGAAPTSQPAGRNRSQSAVWSAARAAAKRRRLQTFVVGVVVFFSTATVVVALALLAASSAPFDRAFDGQRGAHLTVAFDTAKVTDAQLARTATQPGVSAAAGPFAQADLVIPPGDTVLRPGTLTIVGRPDPGGPVDRLSLSSGRWATGPGELVLNRHGNAQLGSAALGSRITVAGTPTLTVVGFAYSVSQTADGWMAPTQIGALHPHASQMLYRFTASATDHDLRAGLTRAMPGLPPDTVIASQSYLVTKQAVAEGPGTYVPFLIVFGVLGCLVASLIVTNIVGGAVAAGFRHIGILKALGFTPAQVAGVYLLMVSIPAVASCVLGLVVGNYAADALLTLAFAGFGFQSAGVAPWVDVLVLVAMPAIVCLAAWVPVSRARKLSASEAISNGAGRTSARGARVQRRLAGTRLPRAVSLGLGLPFARPGRSLLTVVAVALGVTTVTFAWGLTTSVTRYGQATDGTDAIQVKVYVNDPLYGETAPTHDAAATSALLQSLPGTAHVAGEAFVTTLIGGTTSRIDVEVFQGDSSKLGYVVVRGRWLHGPGELVAAPKFLQQYGKRVGDGLQLDVNGTMVGATIVGETMAGGHGGLYSADWDSFGAMSPNGRPQYYEIGLKPGASVAAYTAAVNAADPGLKASPMTGNGFTTIVTALCLMLALALGAVAALGVFNTVVLNTHERRRDLGMLKSIGMTPRQVVVMVSTSMAALGAVGGVLGVPLGVLAHWLIVPVAARRASVDLQGFLMHVWSPLMLCELVLSGVVIALLGALLPARSAARTSAAAVLRSE